MFQFLSLSRLSSLRQLQTIFRFMDVDHNGVIDREEFIRGCSLLDDSLSQTKPELRMEGRGIDGADLFHIIDIDNSGAIDFNELCECFRLHGVIKTVNAS